MNFSLFIKDCFNLGVLSSCVATMGLAHAADKGLWLGGAEYNQDATYAFVGGVHSLNDTLEQGFVVKGWLDWLNYHYESNATEYEVSGPGLELSLGYVQPLRAESKLAGFLGVCYRHVSEKPINPTSDIDYDKCAKAQLEYTAAMGEVTTQLIASYMSTEAYWNRIRVMFAQGNGLQFGTDLVFQGDPNYKAYQLGMVLQGYKLGEATVSYKLGARHEEKGDTLPYVGLEFVN